MQWGNLVFVALGVGFVLLLVLAIRRMAAGKGEQAKGEREREAEPTAEELELASEAEAAAAGEEPGAAAGPGGGEGAGDEGDQDQRDQDDQQTGEGAGAAARPADKALQAEEKDKGKDKDRDKAKKEPDRQEERRRLARGLAKTRGGFIARLGSLFRRRSELDAGLVDEVEEILLTADIGVKTSRELMESLRRKLGKGGLESTEAIWSHLKQASLEMVALKECEPLSVGRARPFVILVVGVNGTGKTTTIGKLAARLKEEGHKVILAAADTFRAAAVEQLEIWGERAGCPVVRKPEGADPSSVIVDTLKQALQTGADVVIVDTAGRLHTKSDLMDELRKVRRTMDKWVKGAPHETFLVLDSTTGQNAIAQARIFKEALDISGLILTKLDGTAKGGVVLGIANELRIPLRFIGIGEKIEDLRQFDAEAFVQALFEGSGNGVAGG